MERCHQDLSLRVIFLSEKSPSHELKVYHTGRV